MINAVGGRKVIFGVLIIAVGVAMAMLAPGGLQQTMVDLLTFIGVGFFLGNGIERTATAIQKKKPSAASAEVIAIISDKVQAVGEALVGVESEMILIKQQNALIGEQNKATQEVLSYIMDKAVKKKNV